MTFPAKRIMRVLPTFCLVASAVLLFQVARGMLSDGRAENYVIGVAGDPPKFSLNDPHCHALRVSRFTVVYRNFKANRHEELWSISPADNAVEALGVHEINYGVVPSGWIESAPAKPIDMNRPNQLVVDSRGKQFHIDIQAGDNWKTNGVVSQD